MKNKTKVVKYLEKVHQEFLDSHKGDLSMASFHLGLITQLKGLASTPRDQREVPLEDVISLLEENALSYANELDELETLFDEHGAIVVLHSGVQMLSDLHDISPQSLSSASISLLQEVSKLDKADCYNLNKLKDIFRAVTSSTSQADTVPDQRSPIKNKTLKK